MRRLHRWVLLAGILGSVGIVRAQEPLEPVGATKPAESNPELIPGTTCRDGNCAPKKDCANCDSSKGERPHKLIRWLTYRPVPANFCSISPTPYRPPLYAYFPPNPNACRSVTNVQPCALPAPAPIAEKITAIPPRPNEALLPKPELPLIVQQQKPFIPGSSSVLAPEPEARPEVAKPVALPPAKSPFLVDTAK